MEYRSFFFLGEGSEDSEPSEKKNYFTTIFFPPRI